MKISPVGAELFPAGSWTGKGQTDTRTDRHEEANSRFSEFCERAQKSHEGNTSLKKNFSTDRCKISAPLFLTTRYLRI
jgi:hypothetical protein